MKTLCRWFLHGLKIIVGGLGAYIVISVPFALMVMVSKISSQSVPIGVIAGLLGLVLIPLCIAGFGFLFTKFYTNTTWGHDAISDMRVLRSSGSIASGQKLPESSLRKD